MLGLSIPIRRTGKSRSGARCLPDLSQNVVDSLSWSCWHQSFSASVALPMALYKYV